MTLEENREQVLRETLDAAHRNLLLARISLEYIEKIRETAIQRIDSLCETIDSIESVLGSKKQPS